MSREELLEEFPRLPLTLPSRINRKEHSRLMFFGTASNAKAFSKWAILRLLVIFIALAIITVIMVDGAGGYLNQKVALLLSGSFC